MLMPQQITILGSTGSIGKSTLQVLALHPEKYTVFALTAHHNVKALVEQCLQFQPQYVVIAQENLLPELRAALKDSSYSGQILVGAEALTFVATHEAVDSVMAAIVGAAGLLPTLAAACAGKRVLLANKEALVMSGSLFMQAVRENGATLLPIDSEHNAIFQCLDDSHNLQGVKRIILTASGGPFRKMSLSDLTQVTPAQACAHPNWSMGAKISVDSATMLNKGLEVIEAS
ncbi:MAG: 1-deoxy-D-xylulose-5-phosphate reductoisomerase, partial [Gammaproteobacteria bacterium]|nr:1-deoxy-D-xylulose-5-phosphate reductoisomerase [Gammaproteobacteria bacterium]